VGLIVAWGLSGCDFTVVLLDQELVTEESMSVRGLFPDQPIA